MTPSEVRDLLKSECQKAGGQAAWIRAQTMFHFSRSTICEVLAGKHEPSPELLAALGLRKRPAEYERVQSDAPLSEVVKELRAVTARYGGLSREGMGE